jgi:RNA polymerase sigma-70 factor (ECF subfamily)
MAARPDGDTLRWIDTLNREGSFARMTDGQLLERFLERTDQASQVAFETLVRRHGPMVLSLCRGVLRDEHDAADAFQATFLVLARRASNIRDRDRLATWLGRVSRRIALRSRAEAARRAALERRISANVPEPAPASVDASGLEIASMVRAEVERLPETDRLLLQLTYWQGKTYEEAAGQLSWPIGTVRSRLSRVRERLRQSLTRLGLAPALALKGPSAPPRMAPTVLPAEVLILQTVRAATRHAGGIQATVEAGGLPATVAALVNGELATMTTISWKSAAALLILGGTATAGAVSLALRAPYAGNAEPVALVAARPATPETRPESQAKGEAKSLLANEGAEEGADDSPRAWSSGAKIPGVEYIWSRDSAHGGKSSLRLKKTAQRYFPIAQWSQKVDRQGNSPRLKVSAWVKADQATKAILDAQFLDGKGEWSHAWAAYIGPKDPDKPPVTHDWKRYEGVVAIPPDTKQIIIAPQIYGPGSVWFDDLDARYTDEPATDPIGS